MKPSKAIPFSLANEVKKLGEILLLPITHIEFDPRYEYGKLYLDDDLNLIIIYAKLYVNDDPIGSLPYRSDKWGPMYDTTKQVELAWDKIYQQFHQSIFSKILQQQKLVATVEIREYKSLNVKDKEGTIINIAHCNYNDNSWEVVLSDPNEKNIISYTTVIICSPPPPINIE